MTKKRVLIVEDQGITALDEKQIMQNMGYEVTGIAMTGEDAIIQADQDKPDIVLMDIRLATKMNGGEAAEKIRERHQIPIIFVSALGDKRKSSGYDVPDGCGYIVKPFTREEFQSEFERLIGWRQPE